MDDRIRPDAWMAFRACRLWRKASDAAVEKLALGARIRQVSRGEMLATEGSPADEFGLVITGKARVYYMGADGKQITFETLESGDPLAAVAALAGSRYPANIEAATDGTVAFASSKALLDLVEDEPAVARSIIGDLASKVVNFTAVIQTLALDVPSRLARYLFQRSLSGGTPTSEGLEIDLGMKKGELALALGTVPETLSRAFAKLRDDGVIELRGSKVLVLDIRSLATLGSGYAE